MDLDYFTFNFELFIYNGKTAGPNSKCEGFYCFYKMQSDPKVMQYMGSLPKTIDEDRSDLNHVIACYDKLDNDFWVWAIERKPDNKMVGTCALIKTKMTAPALPEDEIGYRFLETYWGNGYASEITTELLRFAFIHFGKEALVAEVDELNIASVKILEKQMTFEKAYYSEHYQSNDRKYSVSKAEFLKQYP